MKGHIHPGVKKFFIRHAIASFTIGVLVAIATNYVNFTEKEPVGDRPLIAVGRILSATNCTSNSQCGEGKCKLVQDGPQNVYECVCNEKWINYNGNICSYRQKEQIVAFHISSWFGILGVDWYYLSAGVALYIGLGVLKLLTCGGCCVWAFTDWIRIIVGTFPDGNGVPLKPW